MRQGWRRVTAAWNRGTFTIVSGGVTQVEADLQFSFGGSQGDSSTDVYTYDNGQVTHEHASSQERSHENHLEVDVLYSDGRTKEVIADWNRSSLRERTPTEGMDMLYSAGAWHSYGGAYDLDVTGSDTFGELKGSQLIVSACSDDVRHAG